MRQGIENKMRKMVKEKEEEEKEIDFNEAERNLSQNRMRDLNLYRERKRTIFFSSHDENSTEYTVTMHCR